MNQPQQEGVSKVRYVGFTRREADAIRREEVKLRPNCIASLRIRETIFDGVLETECEIVLRQKP